LKCCRDRSGVGGDRRPGAIYLVENRRGPFRTDADTISIGETDRIGRISKIGDASAVALGWYPMQLVSTPNCHVNRAFVATAVTSISRLPHNPGQVTRLFGPSEDPSVVIGEYVIEVALNQRSKSHIRF